MPSKKEDLEEELTDIQLNHPELRHVRILLHGPVGAGKSCFINSVQSVFKGEIITMAGEESCANKSFTKRYKSHTFINSNSETLPFIINDALGLEKGESNGIDPEDIVSALKGHITEGYKFNPISPRCEEDQDFIREPTLKNKVHCLVSVVPANAISRMDDSLIQKMKYIRKKATDLGIPNVVVMTKVDADVCPLVNKDLTQIYISRKIKEKMQDCENRLGPPMKSIFPVSNYHEETETNNTKDVLILTALLQIVKCAKEYVSRQHTTRE
ncbi:interferon-induced protein 44-like isoform X2 [Colossoma macropomum]|uniref:interferon-induced protein 44-like isoform X2 n=1 Tax=Colossoma macropomum TaxID=42526 RepID=UPI001863A43F|nr:interferon-induced protein 44-like isoform X2 [Colossoma macropomum]